jgi:hypothetical protein
MTDACARQLRRFHMPADRFETLRMVTSPVGPRSLARVGRSLPSRRTAHCRTPQSWSEPLWMDST